MRVRQLSLRDFRNVGFAALTFSGRQQFFLGANGQGKTNLLEAIGFLTALRSFRTAELKALIAHEKKEAAIVCVLEHERLGETRVTVKLGPEGKEVWCDETRILRLTDYLGRFPAVVFSSQDIQLVRGSPTLRRRWLDLTLAAMDPGYFGALQSYVRLLADRNALLKASRVDAAQLAAFEHPLADAAMDLVAQRQRSVAILAEAVRAAYARLAGTDEEASVAYEPNVAAESAAAFRARLESGRGRDLQFRSTLAGPHRDDLRFIVKGAAAKEFGSEGQQRSLMLALRLAQARWFEEKSGVKPVLLADDVLGELDPQRRDRFWAAIAQEAQVIATGTQLPAQHLGAWQVFDVAGGAVAERGMAGGAK